MIRRTWLAAAIAALALTACADADPVPGSESTTSDGSDAGETTTDAAADGDVPARSGESTPADAATGKPAVALPADDPTELVVFDVTPGTGRAAELGDTVVLD